MRLLTVLLLAGCTLSPQHQIEFEKNELLPKPAPGIVILPEEPAKVIYTKTTIKIQSCEATYHDKDSEIIAKLNCLKTLR